VTVKARTKRKSTTTIAGLQGWDIDVRELSKSISKKSAIGCSTKQTATGLSIVVQGDIGRQICEILIRDYKIPKMSIQAIRKAKKQPTPEEIADRNQPPPQPTINSDSSGSGADSDDDENPREHKPQPNPARQPAAKPPPQREDHQKKRGRGGGGRGRGRR
jgi:translation initiation factor 1 (eIF-1/SUI1)